MFTVFKTFSWAALVSVLGYAFTDSPEIISLLINPGQYEAQINSYKVSLDELNSRDQILIQRLTLKSNVFNAFKRHEISIFEAASCFQSIHTQSNEKYDMTPCEHRNFTPDIQACLGLLLWLDDPAFKGNDFELIINDFSDIVNIAKNGGYEINLPLPPAKLLADFIY